MQIILGQPKSPFSFFCKIKDIFFIFNNNFIDLGIWGMSVSPAIGFYQVEARGAAKRLPMHKTTSQQRITWQECQQYQETSQTTSDTFNQSQDLFHAWHKFGPQSGPLPKATHRQMFLSLSFSLPSPLSKISKI